MLALRNIIDIKTRLLIVYHAYFSILQYAIKFLGLTLEAETNFYNLKEIIKEKKVCRKNTQVYGKENFLTNCLAGAKL